MFVAGRKVNAEAYHPQQWKTKQITITLVSKLAAETNCLVDGVLCLFNKRIYNQKPSTHSKTYLDDRSWNWPGQILH